jgi:hypothetical protein
MKKVIVLAFIMLVGFGVAQDTGADFPNGLRIVFSDGTATQLSCTQDGNCRIVRNTSTSPAVTRVNVGFSAKHGYALTVQ